MTPEELRVALAAARDEVESACAALAPKHVGGESERFNRATDRYHSLQRDLARALGEECAVPVEWSAPWCVGAPLPFVIASGSRLFIVYCLRESGLAIVQFHRCLIHKFGAPNDEARSGHPLSTRGLGGYSAHTVERSSWIAEQERINSVHRNHRPESFTELTHYVLPFHDETFECLAKGHTIRESLSTFTEAVQQCTNEALV